MLKKNDPVLWALILLFATAGGMIVYAATIAGGLDLG
jgi:hypothetical protein